MVYQKSRPATTGRFKQQGDEMQKVLAGVFVAFTAVTFGLGQNAYAAHPGIHVMISPCGSPIGICFAPHWGQTEHGGGSGANSGANSDANSDANSSNETSTCPVCESSSWGNQEMGGTQTACSMSDGSGTWSMAEWGTGYHVSESGSYSASTGTITSTATDTMTSH